MTETLTRARPRIDDPAELDRVVRRLVEAFEPVAIYLFGNRARGDARQDSDYDLMLCLTDDNSRVSSRQAVWDTARSGRIDVNPFLTRTGAFAWRRHEAGTLEYEVQVDGIRLHPISGADLRVDGSRTNGQGSMNTTVVEEWLERVRRDLVPTAFADRERFLALERFTKFVWVHRYPGEAGAPPEPEPAAKEVRAWIAEVQALKADFEKWLATRKATP